MSNQPLADEQQLRTRIVELETALREIHPALMEILWCALVWNDHNFELRHLMEHLEKAARAVGCSRNAGVDKANEIHERITALLPKGRPVKPHRSGGGEVYGVPK